MNLPLNNTFNYETLSRNKNIKLETEQNNVAEMVCFFLPHHMTETDIPSERQVDLVQVKEEPSDINNGDAEKDPLAIELTDMVKSENLKVEIEAKSEMSFDDEVSAQVNFNMQTNELNIKEEEMRFYLGDVTIDNGTTKENIKNCITCKRCVNNSVYDESIKEKSGACKCGYGDVIRYYTCNFCLKSFNFRSQLKTHLNIHTKEEIYSCNFCQMSFNRKSNLKTHLNIHSKEKNYVCNFCQKSFNRKSNLKTHLNIHSKEKNYVCNFCQKSFNRICTLKIHLNIHTKEKNYICNFCQKSFNRKSTLKAHLTIHTNEKKYICNFCQKSFYRKDFLNRHINIHTKEENYICNFCQRSFNQKSTLKTHIYIHTKEKNYVCNFCQKSFNRKSNLKTHLNFHGEKKLCLSKIF